MHSRIPQFLSDHEVRFETVVHPPAFTAAKRAHCLHVAGRMLAKSVLLQTPRGHMLAVLPATHQVHLPVLQRVLEGPVRLATEAEIAEVFCDCEWGALAPFGTLYNLPTLIDDSLDPEGEIVFEAAFHAVTIRMRCRDYELLERPRRLRFAIPKG